MRAFGLLILLLAVLGFGVLPNSASAEPCSFHLHPAAAIEHRADIAAAVIAPTAAYEAILGGGLDPATTTPHPVSDHAVPKGHVWTAPVLQGLLETAGIIGSGCSR